MSRHVQRGTLLQVAKAAAESEAASMENSSAEASEQGDSPPASPGAGEKAVNPSEK
jgi:hypothetical protein